ncbi:MAG: DUF1501 domain-containing protein [Planctomycetaceae bacterium]
MNRREFLQSAGGGLGCVALSSLVQAASRPHHAPRATRIIQIFCPGGMSQVDTFDHKPELTKRAGTPFDPDGQLQFFASRPGQCRPGFWKFRQHGESGLWLSDLFPQLATCVDDMAFIYSMHSKTALHGPACFMMNSGFPLPGFPSMGAWVTYGLGSENQNLPAFVVLPDPRGLPPGGMINWGAGFLPAVHQATALDIRNGRDPITDLFPGSTVSGINRDSDRAGLNYLRLLNRRHLVSRPGNTDLEARISAYELAARLQLSAPEVTDLRDESATTAQQFAIEDPDAGPFGRQCLLARRLIERGVRFVQIYCGAENTTAREIRPNWDSHEDLERDHGYWGRVLDTGASALLKDLKTRGLLDETLVMCTTEFGRQPAAQGNRAKGRDHNAGAFTAWLAGGGIRGGVAYGETDDLGYRAVKNPTYSYDIHATMLHLLGLDHTQLTFYHNGIERRLTDVHGHLIHELLA